MNRFKYLTPMFVFFLFLLPLMALADMDEILLNQETMSHKHQRSEVFFPHELHMESLDCLDCHHDYKGGDNVLDEDDLYEDNPQNRCSACHNPSTSMDATEAFHQKCMGCHINAIKDKTKSRGHEMCGSCHVNKDS